MLAIAQRELGTLFRSPIAWVIAAVLQVFFAWYFLATLEQYLAVQDKLALQDNAPGITAFMTFRYLAPCAALLLLICPNCTAVTNINSAGKISRALCICCVSSGPGSGDAAQSDVANKNRYHHPGTVFTWLVDGGCIMYSRRTVLFKPHPARHDCGHRQRQRVAAALDPG